MGRLSLEERDRRQRAILRHILNNGASNVMDIHRGTGINKEFVAREVEHLNRIGVLVFEGIRGPGRGKMYGLIL